MVAAQLPDRMEMYIRNKREQIEDVSVVEFYRELDDMIDWAPGDPRLPALADRLVAQLEAVDEAEWEAFAESGMSDDLVDLLDSMFVGQVPVAVELMRLVEERAPGGRSSSAWTQRFRDRAPIAARRARCYPTWTWGRLARFGSARLITSRVTGATSPTPNSRNRSTCISGLPSVHSK